MTDVQLVDDPRTIKVRELFAAQPGGDAQLIDLWKRFEDLGNDARKQMISMVNGMFLFASGLFSYVIAVLRGASVVAGIPTHPALALGAALLGGATGILALLLVLDFQGHAFRNWWRANNAKNALARLHYIITDRNDVDALSPPDAYRPLNTRVSEIFTWYRTISLLVILAALVLFVLVLLLPSVPPA